MRLRIVFIIAVLIVYGSLYPFNFRIPEPHDAAWIKLFTDWSWVTSKADLLGNLALFFPLGFAGVFALVESARLLPHIAITAVISLVLAVVLQAAQVYTPERTASLADVFWNMIGASAGIFAGCLVRWRPRVQWLHWQTAAVLPVSVVALWLAAELVPFVPSLDVQTIKASVKALIRPTIVIEQMAYHAAGVAIAGWALAVIVGEARSLCWLLIVVGVATVGKAIIVSRVLDISTLCGFALGYGIWCAIARWYEPERSRALMLLLFGTYALNALVPFQIRIHPQPFNLVPFAGLLHGSMLLNSQALAANLSLYAGILALFRVSGASPVAASFALATLVGLCEVIQTHLVGRAPDVTDPLLVLVVGQMIAVAPLSPPRQDVSSWPAEPHATVTIHPPDREGQRIGSFSFVVWAITLGIICLVMALAFYTILRLPKVPYNVAELFRGKGAFPFLFMFALALLWVGAGGRIIGHYVATSLRPYLLLPPLAFGAGVVSLLLFSASVTQESISDISGSNNLHWFVINKDIWGTWARQIFLLIPADVVGFFERPVRYAALYSPLVTFLALFFAGVEMVDNHGLDARRAVSLLLCFGLWLWLCKAIAFDWSSTDNLNELIARDGPWGWGGGGYLYALLALVCANGVLLARMPLTIFWVVISTFLTFSMLPVGWWLLNNGLEQQVHKYETVFSGVQFLLGPDRKDLLNADVLFLRWCVVQFGGVLVIVVGARLAQPIIAWQASQYRQGGRALAASAAPRS